MNRALRRNLLCIALAFTLASASGALLAQNVTGSIYGNVGSDSGAVIVENLDSGSKITITPDATGRYNAATLPAGRYKVSLERDGAIISSRENIQVLVGRGTEVGFTAPAVAGDATQLDRVQVIGTGIHQIDVSQVESRMVITKSELERLPVAPNLTAIALLAPGVVEGDSRYPKSPTVSGSSASENAYYINGYPVTNPLTNVGYSELPYNSVDQIQLSTGGYGVEYGRATGGVVNVITSRGGNTWKAGGQVKWRPEELSGNARNIYYGPNNRASLTWGNAGQLYQYRKENKQHDTTASLYVGGPIIQDRLFFYASGEMIRTEKEGVRSFASSATAVNTARRTGWSNTTTWVPRWLGKVDWNINDDHRVEVTGFSDRTKERILYSGFDYVSLVENDVESGEGGFSDSETRTYVGNYTGFLTDNLTLSAMYGESDKSNPNEPPYSYSDVCPSISIEAGAQVPGLAYANCQFTSGAIQQANAFDKTNAWRLDLEYRLSNHTIKVGYDYNESSTRNGRNSWPGGYAWIYSRLVNPNEPVYAEQGVGSPASGGGYGLQGYYVTRNISILQSNSRLEQAAQYVKDLWQVSDTVLVELGLRNEQFTNYNSAGRAFLEKTRQLAPRFGVTWDVNGDSSLKAFGYAGRYHLAIPNYISRRMADGALNTSQAFTYTGIDPVTGAPLGTVSLGPVYSTNNEFGEPKDPRTIAPTGLKSHSQDSMALGLEKKLSIANVGAKFSYSTLRSAIDDFCDGRQGRAWALRNGYTEEQAQGLDDHLHGCVMLNPGEDNTYLWDMDGDGELETINLTASELGFPKLKRKYYALDFFFERPFDGKWYVRADYTFSKNWGNMEGQLNSDLGQADVSSTVTSDYPELSEYSSGYLPNHRRHQVKMHGYYQLADEWMVSTNLIWADGRPQNCMGGYPFPTDSPNYGSYHFYCNGVPSPRGTYGKLPDTYRWDFGVRYNPNWANGLSFHANLFNAFNRQSTANIEERYNSGRSLTTLNPNWGRTISYTTPRYLELAVRYDWGN